MYDDAREMARKLLASVGEPLTEALWQRWLAALEALPPSHGKLASGAILYLRIEGQGLVRHRHVANGQLVREDEH